MAIFVAMIHLDDTKLLRGMLKQLPQLMSRALHALGIHFELKQLYLLKPEEVANADAAINACAQNYKEAAADAGILQFPVLKKDRYLH